MMRYFDSTPGCQTSGGFRSPGSSWQMPGCARGVCAVTLQGGFFHWLNMRNKMQVTFKGNKTLLLTNRDTQSMTFVFGFRGSSKIVYDI